MRIRVDPEKCQSHNRCKAADPYACALCADPGAPELRLRAGTHIGPLQIEEGDVFGRTVNFAARVVGAIKGAEIWLCFGVREGPHP